MRQLAHSPLRYYLLTSLIVLLFGAVAPLTFAITGSQREESLRLSSLAASFDQSRADLYDLASSFDRYKATGRADLLSSYGAAKNDFERSLRALRLESRRLALDEATLAEIDSRYEAFSLSAGRALSQSGAGDDEAISIERRQALVNALGDAASAARLAAAQSEARLAAQERQTIISILAATLIFSGLLIVFGIRGARAYTRGARQAVDSVSRASKDFSAVADRLARGSVEQAAAVEQMTATMEQLSRAAEQIAIATEHTREGAEAGRSSVVDALEGMERVKARVEAVAQSSLDLGQKSERIGEITELISDIANKTHLLALNATIESAAAGEHGRRFAVVASQIRELADDTREATSQVKAVVAEIRRATEVSVEATRQANAEADSGSLLARRAGEAIEDMHEMIETISRSTNQQRGASELVVRTMHDLAEVAKETADEGQLSAEAASRLEDSAREMRLFTRLSA